jgi:hypothetical protein
MTMPGSIISTGRMPGGPSAFCNFSSERGTYLYTRYLLAANGERAKDIKALPIGSGLAVDPHHFEYGWKCQQHPYPHVTQPWSPGEPHMAPPEDWVAPRELLRVHMRPESGDWLWVDHAGSYAINGMIELLELWASEPEMQAGLVPVTEIVASREATNQQRPGSLYYKPNMRPMSWVTREAAGLGLRRAQILPPQFVTKLLGVPTTIRAAPLPPITASVSAVDVPWTETPEPKPLPSVAEPSVATPSGSPAVPEAGTDPFDIFRRR